MKAFKHISRVLFFCVAFSICLSAQQTTEPLTNQRIIELAHGGMRSEELARIIATAPQVSFDPYFVWAMFNDLLLIASRQK